MDALKKFLTKKKIDKNFKAAGPGHKLTETAASQGPQTSKQPASRSNPVATTSVSDEKRAAAAAALARVEKNKKPEANSKELLASRQLAFIKEQAKKELDAEKIQEAIRSQKKEAAAVIEDVPKKIITVADYAVSGVFFSCPLISPEVLPKEKIEENIKEFLLEQPEEELGVTACLLIYSCNKPREKVTVCVDTLCTILDNIIGNPDEPKFKRIKCSNRNFQEKVAPVVGSIHFLRAAGFVKQMIKVDPAASTEEEFWVFTSEDKDSFIPHLIELRDTLKQTTPIRAELDRNVQVLMPAEVHRRKELPEEFYTLSLDEIKKEQKLKAELAERETTLRTQAMRERDELREQRLYRYGIMRVRFPDGLTLQGTFKAFEKVSDLYQFVKENLVNEEVSFELIKSGGECLSEMNSTLAESKLTPASIVNFKVSQAPPVLLSGEMSFLKPEMLALVKNLEVSE